MSKIYYDQLLDLQPVEKAIKKVAKTHEEKLELWQVVDEIVQHKIMNCILDHLPKELHSEYLEKFYSAPDDEKLLDYLKEKVKKDITLIFKEAVAVLVLELMGWYKQSLKHSCYNENYHGQRKIKRASKPAKRPN